MKLFHGSNIEIHVPDLSRSKPYKDFGQGFYLSDNYLQAEEMAMHKVDQLRTGSKCISVFEFDEQHLISGELDIRIFDDYSEEWAYFILANRDKYNTKPIHHHDIVIGPIADDGVTFQLRRFSTGIIPMEKLIEELKFHKGKTILRDRKSPQLFEEVMIKQEQIQFLIEEMTREIIIYLMQDFGYDMDKAFEIFYNSDTFERLNNTQSGLYYQSSGYVYSFLKEELLTGKVG